MLHGPRKKRSDFGGNSDHVTLGLGLEYSLGLRIDGGQVVHRVTVTL